MVMALKVKGFLASDGAFFENQPECQRHEFAQAIMKLCESHSINPDNFFELLREWHEEIKGYYDADSRCITKAAIPIGSLQFGDTVLQDSEDHEDPTSRDKDSPGFLEFAARKHK